MESDPVLGIGADRLEEMGGPFAGVARRIADSSLCPGEVDLLNVVDSLARIDADLTREWLQAYHDRLVSGSTPDGFRVARITRNEDDELVVAYEKGDIRGASRFQIFESEVVEHEIPWEDET